jgi:hypothetical protein
MVIKPSALNVVIIGASMILFSFLWKLAAGAMVDRNPRLAGAMSLVA